MDNELIAYQTEIEARFQASEMRKYRFPRETSTAEVKYSVRYKEEKPQLANKPNNTNTLHK